MKFSFLFFSFLLTVSSTFAQDIIKYSISFPNAVHHEAEVVINVPNVPSGPLTFRMSRSSPGRYATHEFGKNVYSIKAYDGKDNPLILKQTEGDVYQVEGHGGNVRITYTVYGNRVDGTYLAIDETHAHINIPAAFMWFPSLTKRPVELRLVDIGKFNWKVSTQLKPLAEPATYWAEDFQYFMDSPLELSDHFIVSWPEINPGGKSQTIQLSSHSSNDDSRTISNFADMVKRMVRESREVYGELPEFDYGSYIFLQDVNPDNAGDGMEHRNSTVITNGGFKIGGNEERMLGTFSHEFFHIWNVERIRPKTLEPFDFSKANMTSDLWFAEGFTQYYGNLILKRAGLRTDEEYNAVLSGILNGVLNSPGAAQFPATHMSRYAVFVDAGVSIDQNNYANNFTSYYTYGAFIALGLDLRLRSEFNLTLDDFMRAVWKAHGKTGIPYTDSDLQKILGSLTNPGFASDFFTEYIRGTGKNDYRALLAKAGLVLRKANPGKASIGPAYFTLISYTGKNRLAGAAIKGTPLYEAGIDIGDYVLKIGEENLLGNINLENLLDKYKPGQSVTVTFEHKGTVKTSVLTFREDNTLEVVAGENAGPEQVRFRNNWLSSKIK